MRPAKTSAAEFVPERPTLPKLQQAVQRCRGCDLYRFATQAVFGEGPVHASILFIGEQPGNDEDLQGRPFVGPAGKLLDRALAEAGIDRSDVYVTNAVKHFKFEERGKRRLHKKPRASEVEACYPWLDAELAVIQPKIVVCLGATAAQAMLGPAFRLTKERGKFFPHDQAPRVTATVHPSAILRAPDAEQRHAQYRDFVADLKRIRDALDALPSPPQRETRPKPPASAVTISDSGGARSVRPRPPLLRRRTPRSSSG
ncbi:MAG TPA: UdgX family uracil-DNA binding protein [Bryobacteraceae bacterium]|nr:UdgX family uracil-DNA binding protein [Bryobacteraceae bacterium]